jgi:hypothetical protein
MSFNFETWWAVMLAVADGVEAVYGQKLSTAFINAAGLNGLVIHAFTPAALPLFFISFSAAAVSISTGINLQFGKALTALTNSIPSITGMLKSHTTILTERASK